MKIFVIGGTRFIGMYAVQSLLAQEHNVTLFNRSGPKIFENKVAWKEGDRNDTAALKQALKDVHPDVILDMIPIVEEHARSLIDAASGQAPRIVSISSMDVYKGYGVLLGIEKDTDQPVETPFTETSPVRTTLYPYRGPDLRPDNDPSKIMDDYDKILVENRIMNHKGGTVLRLPLVYGPGDNQHRMFEFLKRMMDKRPSILISETYAHWRASRAYAANIGHGIALAITKEQAIGEIFNIAEKNPLSTLEWVQLISKACGWKGSIVLTGPESTPDHLNIKMNTAQHLIGDTQKIREMLGYSEPISQAQSILRTVEWESENAPSIPDDQMEKIFDYAAEDNVLLNL